MTLRKSLLATLLCTTWLTATAQSDELEYLMDFGGGIGVAMPIGDGTGALGNIGPEGGLLVRRIFNPRMALKARLTGMYLGGSTSGYLPTDAQSKTPEGGEPTTVKWKRGAVDVGCSFELNFWGFGSGPEYKGNKPITPYISAGVGAVIGFGSNAKTTAGLSIPLAIGLKYKLKPRLNLEVEWSVHFTTTDRLDATPSGTQLADPYGIKSGPMKNKDCYTLIQVSLTYDMLAKLRKCNN